MSRGAPPSLSGPARPLAGLLAALAAGAWLAGGPGAAGQDDVVVERDLPYVLGAAAGPRQRLDLFLPARRPGAPLVLFLHGGGWTAGDKNESPGVLYDNVGRALAARGIGVALANYRLTDGSAEGVVHPGHVEDAADAFAFLRSLMVARGLDPANLFVMGHEAGAHLAALVATDGRLLARRGLAATDVRAVIGLSGIYAIDPEGGAYADVFGRDPAARRDASPVAHVGPGAPPFLALYAAADAPGTAQAIALAGALGRAEVPHEVLPVAGRDAVSIVTAIGAEGDEVTERLAAFVLAARRPTRTPTASPTARPDAPTPTPRPTSAPAAPPGQPADGPGGAARPHGPARRSLGADGRAWIREPDGPRPASAPVVVFLADTPADAEAAYGTWLEHLARGGASVVVPDYARGAPSTWTDAAARALAAALAELETGDHVRPQRDRLVYVGHGAGATVAANLAGGWFARRLPVPRALLAVAPRDPGGVLGPELARAPGDMMTVFVALADDAAPDPETERAIWHGLAGVPGPLRARFILVSDRYGTPPLVADGRAPFTGGPSATLDALDWFGTWKWADALVGCALAGESCERVLGMVPEAVDMGLWADGRPVRPSVRTDAPPPAPTWRACLPFAERS